MSRHSKIASLSEKPCFLGSFDMFICKNTCCFLFIFSASLFIFSANLVLWTVWITSNKDTAFFVLFDCRCPIKCRLFFLPFWIILYFFSASWTLLSPKFFIPAIWAAFICWMVWCFVTPITVTGWVGFVFKFWMLRKISWKFFLTVGVEQLGSS